MNWQKDPNPLPANQSQPNGDQLLSHGLEETLPTRARAHAHTHSPGQPTHCSETCPSWASDSHPGTWTWTEEHWPPCRPLLTRDQASISSRQRWSGGGRKPALEKGTRADVASGRGRGAAGLLEDAPHFLISDTTPVFLSHHPCISPIHFFSILLI